MTKTEIVITIITSILGSAGLFGFIQFLIARKDKRNDLLMSIDKKVDVLERDGCRTQLLVLFSDYPENEHEILTLAEHYFKDLEGNWYLSAIFAKWLEERKISKPNWFTH